MQDNPDFPTHRAEATAMVKGLMEIPFIGAAAS